MGRSFSFIFVLLGGLLTQCNAAQGGILSGQRQKCNNEGEAVFMEDQIKNMNCFSCICKNGLVECHPHHCPPTEGCHLLIGRKNGECCNYCKGCMYKGNLHESHTEWSEPGEPCTVLRCEAGIITESDLQCYTPCSRPIRPAPGKCCATCPGCRINGQNVTRDVTIPEDPCVKCHCEDGKMTCLKKACPVLQCSGGKGKVYKPPGECCPQCQGIRSLIPVKKLCLVGSVTYRANEKFEKDRCTHCTCMNETAICRRNSCPVLECDVELQEMKPGACCPHCPPIEEFRSVCTVAGKVYQDGESWQLDACKSCMCQKGETRCAMQRCPPIPMPCPPNTRLVRPPGQCCSKCVENDGVCTVFGDPHYKTFDGKFFSFQGSCKYQLATDCLGNNSFSVRVTNDPRKTKYSAWTKVVSIKAGDLKVNLGQKLRIKVNGKKVEAPFAIEGRVRIDRNNDSVFVQTHVGIGVLWNGRGFLEVSASTNFKGKLCGLCGNFNSIAQDDLTMRNKRIVTDTEVWRFANSWKVGGKKACGRPNEHNYKKPQCKLKNNKNPCRTLKLSHQFGDCDAKLSPSNYYEACVQDMCECPNGNCYCESFAAYAHECTRLGAVLRDWRTETRCRIGGGKRRNQDRQNHRKIQQTSRRTIFNAGLAKYPNFERSRLPSKLPIN